MSQMPSREEAVGRLAALISGIPVAMLTTAFYAVTYFFWFYSVTTEQYTSAVFQTLLIVWLDITAFVVPIRA